MKKALIAGASGATGKLLVEHLLNHGVDVIAVVRAASSMRGRFGKFANYHEVLASISEMSDEELAPHVSECDAVFSCLGHNLTFRGVFGKPRRLVTDTVKSLARIIESLDQGRKVRLILMNTTGNSNRDIPEVPPLSQRVIISILRIVLPPHVDNEQAAEFLRSELGQDHRSIEWSAVRPGGLIDEAQVTDYVIQPSPGRNVIFDDGSTSRINVAHFMASLATEDGLWHEWKGKMPVIYNSQDGSPA